MGADFGVGRWYDYGARWYDASGGRFTSVDPLAEDYSFQSPYAYATNNPVLLRDILGMGVESTHIDEYGNVIAEYDDGDDGVYVYESGTTQKQINFDRVSTGMTGGLGLYIGDLGGELDISSFFGNKLDVSAVLASVMSISEWVSEVKKHGNWDLKNNKTTIFGVAWNFDKTNSGFTKFKFGDISFEHAADVGNFHAGFTGAKAGIPANLQFVGAGVIEQLKKGTFLKGFVPDFRYPPGKARSYFSPPYNDRTEDYIMNRKGILYGQRYNGAGGSW